MCNKFDQKIVFVTIKLIISKNKNHILSIRHFFGTNLLFCTNVTYSNSIIMPQDNNSMVEKLHLKF